MTHDEIEILVVDDVNTMRMQIKELLRSFGFRNITVAANGEEAKKFLAEKLCHLILADWHMIPTDGLELLKYIRATPNLKSIPFVMITAENTKEKVIEVVKAGVDDYLMKPLTRGQIETKVYAILLRRKILG